MDLDMIQDLLGGSNLPPPPSVQDLLGDVVPIARSPTPPTPPASLRLTAEHNYSKPATELATQVGERMEQVASSPGSEILLSLDSSGDCYETFLLNLLKVYTQNKIHTASAITASSNQPNSTGSNPATTFTVDSISPEAINSLSSEQIQALVTSNSTNCDVIHQILAFKQKLEGGGGTVAEKGGEVGEKVQGASSDNSADEAMSALQQLQALQLTPEQLKQIQVQMSELIRTKQIVLPTELSVDQQQQLLQSLILKQVHSQHQQQQATTPPTTSTTVTTAQPPTPTTKSIAAGAGGGGVLAAMLSKDVEKQERDSSGGRGAGGKAMKMEVPPPSSHSSRSGDVATVALQLSHNPVTDGTAQAAATVTQAVSARSTGRKKKDGKEDEPKKPTSPYGIFFSDVYPSVLQANPKMSFSEASKLIAAMWNAMGVDTKKQYHDRSVSQKEKYQAFLESQKSDSTVATPSNTPVLATQMTPAVERENLGRGTQAVGQSTQAVGQTTHAVGQGTQAVGQTTHTVGQGTQAVGQSIQAVGQSTQAMGRTVQVEVMATAQQAAGSEDTQTGGQTPPPAPIQPKPMIKDPKLCVNDGCLKDAAYTEFRGPRYCSNECVVQHCRSVFQEWVAQRKVAT